MAKTTSLYDPRYEHDGCGIGFVAHVSGKPSHGILELALQAVAAMRHRGPMDVDPRTGDGAGVLTQVPYQLLAQSTPGLDPDRFSETDLGVGMIFLPRETQQQNKAKEIIRSQLAFNDLPLLAWRPVPVNPSALDPRSLEQRPDIVQCLVLRPDHISPARFEE